MTKTWKSGDIVVMRGIYKQRPWYVQSAVVIHDEPKEVALAVLPGAECFAPEGYINGKHGTSRQWNRWDDYINDNWKMQGYNWHTNRLLYLIEPEKFYASIYFWHDDTNQFLCYYINFQLPFQRSEIGFDTLDLELDIIIEPTYKWSWKDLNEYRAGIHKGIILKEWADQIDCAKLEILEKIEKRQYPLDGQWLDWKPDPNWRTPKLPENWSKV